MSIEDRLAWLEELAGQHGWAVPKEEAYPNMEARITELERKINLLADRVLHYYNHTTPEIEALNKRHNALIQRVEDLEQGMERLGPIIGHK